MSKAEVHSVERRRQYCFGAFTLDLDAGFLRGANHALSTARPRAAVHVFPPSLEPMYRILECPAGSPKEWLVELLHAKYTFPLRTAMAGCNVMREALTYLGNPNLPGPGFVVP